MLAIARKNKKRTVCNIATDSGKNVVSSSEKYSSCPQDEEGYFVILAKGFRGIVLRDSLKVDQEKYKLLLQEEVKKMMGL